jgi:hypothetical protein
VSELEAELEQVTMPAAEWLLPPLHLITDFSSKAKPMALRVALIKLIRMRRGEWKLLKTVLVHLPPLCNRQQDSDVCLQMWH